MLVIVRIQADIHKKIVLSSVFALRVLFVASPSSSASVHTNLFLLLQCYCRRDVPTHLLQQNRWHEGSNLQYMASGRVNAVRASAQRGDSMFTTVQTLPRQPPVIRHESGRHDQLPRTIRLRLQFLQQDLSQPFSHAPYPARQQPRADVRSSGPHAFHRRDWIP